MGFLVLFHKRYSQHSGRNIEMMKQWMKRIGLTLGAGVLLAACGGSDENAANDGANKELAIGILQLMDHESLNASRQGFVDVLEEAGYVEGENLTLDYQNAQGDQANLQTMSERLAGDNDLILAIATPAVQSLANIEKDTPILFTAVTDPVDAGLVASLEKPGANITGTTDAGPIEEQVKLLLSVAEDAENIGIIYNSSEPNSVIQAEQAKSILEENDQNVVVLTVSSTNDVQQAMESLAQDVDGVYIPTDNTLASTMATVAQVAKNYKLPVVAAAADQVLDGGLATYGIDYYELGRQTGEMALDILENGATTADMAVQSSKNLELVVNEEMAEALGIDPASITVPE